MIRFPWGLFSDQHPDGWAIEIAPGRCIAEEQLVEHDVVVRFIQPTWRWVIQLNGRDTGFMGVAESEERALEHAVATLPAARLMP